MKQFKAESKRLLDLMINSIYTNQEIFLRELISNASDATDKLHFKGLQDTDVNVNNDDLKIELSVDAEKRQLIIRDHGIGMTKEGLESNLGTIAQSDSYAFKEAIENGDDVDIIGQFGVGFYSAFMVSSKVEVISRAYGSDDAYVFESNGIDGYSIKKAELDSHGTLITLTLKENAGDIDYDKYLDSFTLKSLVKQYSDYVRYPIVMEDETINSMIPLWKRSKQNVTQEDLDTFYIEKFHDFEKPMRTIQMKVEGNPSFDALLYIPNRVPMNFYSQQYEPGLQLYSRGVFIMDHNKSLIPEHFRFVRGLVDSPDLSLNISREILQNDQQLSLIANRIERKIRGELELLLKNDESAYKEFWKNFGLPIKYGLYSSYGMKRDVLEDLLMFNSSRDNDLVTLNQYVEAMKDDQEVIYYVSGTSLEKVKHLPQTEFVVSKGYDVLYLVDEIDEFVIQVLSQYKDKAFKSISQGDLGLDDEETIEKLDKRQEEAVGLLSKLKEALEGKVDEVKLSTRLGTHPVGLVSEEGISLEMERVLSQMPDQNQDFKAKRVLEINPDHALLNALEKVYEKDNLRIDDLALVLYDQACLIEGLPIEDPIEFSKRLAQLMIDAS